MFAWLERVLGLRSIPRLGEAGPRAAVLALFGRFVDEVASGLPLVLMPTLQRRLGLSVGQVGWCIQALYGAAAVVEPVAGAAIDVARRRPLLVWGALGWALSLLMVAGAPSFAWLLAAFLVAGTASGPLAHTTDVLLVEMHPGHEERIGARQTLLDSVGALLAPAAVALAGWAGGDLRLPLVVSGVAILVYAGLLAATPMPGPARRPGSAPTGAATAHAAEGGPATVVAAEGRWWAQVRAGASEVLRSAEARIWLAAMLAQSFLDIPELFEPVWLASDVGASQSLVAVHSLVELATALVGLALLDRLLLRYDGRTILTVACVASLVAYPAWLLVPGVAAKVLLVVPRTLATTPVWPLVRARMLASVPGRGGMLMAVTSLYGALPLPALFGWLGGRAGLGRSMFAVHTGATLAILAIVRRRTPRAGPGHAGRG